MGCRSIAYTYNDPVIFAEYAIDIAQLAHERGIKTVAVNRKAGYNYELLERVEDLLRYDPETEDTSPGTTEAPAESRGSDEPVA